jgi:hypothetical protein
MQRACQKSAAWHGSCSSFCVTQTQNNFGQSDTSALYSRFLIATASMDVTRKQRFGLIPAVSSARRGLPESAGARATVAPRSGTHCPSGEGFELPEGGQGPLSGAMGPRLQHVNRTAYEKCTRWNPRIRGGYFLFTGCCGARATKQRKNISRPTYARAEADWVLKRCCPVD